MAATAGGGGSAVSVLAPNGRRHTVKVTPSTVLLQVRRRRRPRRGQAGAAGGGRRRRGRGAWPAPAVGSGGPRGRGMRGAGHAAANQLPPGAAVPPPSAPGACTRDFAGPSWGWGLAGWSRGRGAATPRVRRRASSRVPVLGRPPGVHWM